MPVPLVDLDGFYGTHRVILLDLELTCWEGSLESDWSDPARPPEVIEIGLAAYDILHGNVLDTFSARVRPRVNPVLSEYCKSLVRISQDEIDRSRPLAAVLENVGDWCIRARATDVPTCSWGSDRGFLSADAGCSNCGDPFGLSPHMDLRSMFQSLLGYPSGAACERDRLREVLGLGPNHHRHRALDDAVDLAQFCRALRRRLAVRREEVPGTSSLRSHDDSDDRMGRHGSTPR